MTAFGIVGGQDASRLIDPTLQTHGGFSAPAGMSIDASGSVWVADANNNRIEKFSAEGAWLDSLRPSKTGGAEDEFWYPLDVYVDGYGTTYVADQPNAAPFSSGRFSRWGPQKDPLGEYGDQKPGGGVSFASRRIYVDSWGGIWINDNLLYDDIAGALEHWGLNAGEPDLVAPVTTTDAPSDWVNHSIHAHLQAVDTSSPVVATYWSSDGSTPTAAYEDSITVSLEGSTTLKFFSIDRPGNAEAVKSHDVLIDYQPPNTVSNIVPIYYQSALISLTSTDALSGPQDVWYRLNGGQPILSSTVVVNIQGPHHLEYWGEDGAGNREASHHEIFTVMPNDADPPETYWRSTARTGSEWTRRSCWWPPTPSPASTRPTTR